MTVERVFSHIYIISEYLFLFIKNKSCINNTLFNKYIQIHVYVDDHDHDAYKQAIVFTIFIHQKY